MLERYTILNEAYTFQPKPISPAEQRFKAEKTAKANWENALIHVIDNYPQKEWRLTGSAGLALYYPGLITPKDVDLFTPNEKFAEQFSPPGLIDVKTIEFTLTLMGVPVNQKNSEYLMNATFLRKFKGRSVLVSALSVIIFSKSHPAPRLKDIPHLEVTRHNNSAVERVRRKLLAA